ncbi:MAG: DUF433 domain-containing protein [Nitrospira sp.]|nr:DUF433 domain-containing protein [Nitrospira sp.]
MSHAVKTEHCYVHKDLGVCGGEPVIAGTRIPVRLIYQRTQNGDNVETIRQAYPNLTPAQVHDALSYAYDHLAEIEQEIQREAKAYQQGKTLPSR